MKQLYMKHKFRHIMMALIDFLNELNMLFFLSFPHFFEDQLLLVKKFHKEENLF
jgi:hypothetical protein